MEWDESGAMAHLHFQRAVYKSGGKHASARVRYITRETEHAPPSSAERQLRYIARDGREDLMYTRSRHLPAWAQGNPHTYFKAAEQYERANGNAFEEWKITLPQELSPGQNMRLMRDLVEAIAGNRLPITYAFHCPQTLDNAREQPHLHLLLSGRQADDIERPMAQFFKRYNPAHPDRGGAKKDAALSHYGAVKGWRITITDVVNLHLERAGCPDRIHPDSLTDQGIAREPEPKLLPSDSHAYRKNGTVSTTMAKVLENRAKREQTRGDEQANARDYWEARKVTLGLTEGMDTPAQLAAICTARAQVRDQVPERTVAQGYAGVEQDDRTLGDLAGEAYRQAQSEAQEQWSTLQNVTDSWALHRRGRELVQETRRTAHEVWRDTQEDTQIRDLGREAVEDAWREAVLLWAEDQGMRALRDVGWDAVHEAWESGQEDLEAALQHERLVAEAQGWQSLDASLEALARQLDVLSGQDGARGHMRIRLWEREQGMGL
jgi:hypothetical protein